jgi:hypothetical protein
LKQKYYSILKNDVKELEAEISEELEDYVNNTNIHEIYQSLNSKIKKIKHYNKIVYHTFCTSCFVAMSLLIAPLIAFDVTTKDTVSLVNKKIIKIVSLLKLYCKTKKFFQFTSCIAVYKLVYMLISKFLLSCMHKTNLHINIYTTFNKFV